ncbi:MAG: hypothetical protein ACYDD0_02920 [Candidatus Dormibacteria bacterium]
MTEAGGDRSHGLAGHPVLTDKVVVCADSKHAPWLNGPWLGAPRLCHSGVAATHRHVDPVLVMSR